MIVRCLAALGRQPPKLTGARPLARGVDGESACRAIMVMPSMRHAAPHRSGCVSVNSGVNDLATPRQPERPEVVTHVLGTFRYLCVRAGQKLIWSEWQDSNLRPLRPERTGQPPTPHNFRYLARLLTTGQARFSPHSSPLRSSCVQEPPSLCVPKTLSVLMT
jgi:hypothetical protein